jgi:hypothetical protein
MRAAKLSRLVRIAGMCSKLMVESSLTAKARRLSPFLSILLLETALSVFSKSRCLKRISYLWSD